EYVSDKQAMQVVALGDGEFDIVVFESGLPGAGASVNDPRRIDGDSDVVADLIESMNLKRIERTSPTIGAKPPAGAVVLFDGTTQSATEHWVGGKVSDSGLLMQGTTSKDQFQDYTLHLEFRTPWMPDKTGQARGNSGVYHQARYETQVLDSFGLKGRNNETGGIYSVRDPDLNMCLPPLQWQTYDIDFTAARFNEAGEKTSNAKITVRLNGVAVQNGIEIPKKTTAAPKGEGASPGPIYLQDHGAPVRYRNIWVLPRDAKRDARRPIVPGFERFFVGTSPSADGGELLISSLACDACHASDRNLVPQQRGPDLTAVAARVRADALVQMIRDPHGFKPGTTMPIAWHDADEVTRRQRSEAVASYLLLGGNGELNDRPVSRKQVELGQKLYHEVGCVACHQAFVGAKTPVATTVPLNGVARKYTASSLAVFLSNPHQVRPGLRMPALTGSAENAAAIAAYLTREVTLRENKAKFDRSVYRGSWQKLPDFANLEPVQVDRVAGLKLNDIKPSNNLGLVFSAKLPIHRDGKYTFQLSSDDGSRLLIDGHQLDNDGIHPNQMREATFELKSGVHPVRVEFFNGGGQIELSLTVSDADSGSNDISQLILDPDNPIPADLLPSAFVPQESLVEQGKALFESSGCASCHQFGPQADAPPAIAISALRPNTGCLADEVPPKSVDYELSLTQRAAIHAALKQRKNTSSQVNDEQRVHLTMAALNCYACHSRGKLGGPELSRDSHFVTRTPEMGLEGRLPPSLDGVGDKLNDNYTKQILNQGANLRPYMRTRMPGYRYEPLAVFHQAINRLDRKQEAKIAERDEPHEAIVASGRQAVGNRGLACIKCHSFGGNKGGGIGAIDMLKMTERLREDWFHRYLQNPTKYRPGTRMPNSFVDGRSALTSLYDGDPTLQIDSMWDYLVDGDQAKEPEGLKEGAIVLSGIDRPRIYRNFFTDVSGRGIGIGYPQGVNLIWDAERMTLARLWKNSFVDASMHWRNRGQGRQQPLGDAIVDVETETTLARLGSIGAEWPSEPGRALGMRFRGYKLDGSGNPTFRYSMGDITIEDTPVPTADQQLKRQLVFAVPKGGEQPLVWQVVSGVIKNRNGVYNVKRGFELSIEGVECELTSDGKGQHLRAILPVGTTRVQQTISW
ncbi:MAG: family 16 glycoside hydrolase, partial [Rubripirellula sp.]